MWPWIVTTLEQYGISDFTVIHLFLPALVHLIALIVVNIGFYTIYKLDHPFFEKYKINPDPWPW